jgi:thiol-disulfide isomerase/thioredoxin
MEIRGTLLGGEEFDQKSLAGKVVLVSFWATSCGPCVEKMPHILALYEKYHAKELARRLAELFKDAG